MISPEPISCRPALLSTAQSGTANGRPADEKSTEKALELLKSFITSNNSSLLRQLISILLSQLALQMKSHQKSPNCFKYQLLTEKIDLAFATTGPHAITLPALLCLIVSAGQLALLSGPITNALTAVGKCEVSMNTKQT